MYKDKSITTLFQNLLKNECSPEEIEILVNQIARKDDDITEELIFKQLEESVSSDEISEEIKKKLGTVLERILKNDAKVEPIEVPVRNLTHGKRWIKISMRYAAAIILLVMTGIAWFVLKDNPGRASHPYNEILSTASILDFEAGSSKAILMTEDGNTIYLDETVQNKSEYKGFAVIKPEEGLITYNTKENSDLQTLATKEIAYNTIIIPRGGKFKITLSDGTRVWMNSASSLKFPEVFNGTEREVELTGEGYFEVAKNAVMPFKVKVNGMEVKVLGTHFNVNGYTDNGEVKTTLLEGSVEISNNHEKVMLAPGQQVSYKENKLGRIISNINMEQVVAWKNDDFDFTNESLLDISRQLSRWYQVEISVEGNLATKRMSGIISRKNTISKVLEVLEIGAGIGSKMEGEKVFLYKK